MDIVSEIITNDHVHDEAPSPRKKRTKINDAAEAPPAKRTKSSTEAARPSKLLKVSKTPRASTVRTRAARNLDSQWSTVVPSDAHQVPSDLVLVDTRPRLWAMSRAELGSAFVEVSDSKCVNSISWTLTDMPIVILDNKSMVIEKTKDAGNELSMDLILIREFRSTNPSTLQKSEDTTMNQFNSRKASEGSGNDSASVPASAIFQESPSQPGTPHFNINDASKLKRGKPRNVQCNTPDELVLGTAQGVSRPHEREQRDDEPPATSTHILDTSRLSVKPTPKSKREKKQQETSHISTSESFPDTAQGISRSKKRGKVALEPLRVPPQILDPSNAAILPTPRFKLEAERQGMSHKPTNESLDPGPGVSQLKERKKANCKTQTMATPSLDPTKSNSTAPPKLVAGKIMRQMPKTLELSTDGSPLKRSDTSSFSTPLNSKLRTEGAKGKQRKDSEKSAHEPFKSGPSLKPEREGAQRNQKLEKISRKSFKRRRSPGPLNMRSACAQTSKLERRRQRTHEQRSKCSSQVSQKKELMKVINKSIPNAVARAPPVPWSSTKDSVLASLRFTKNKNPVIDVPIPKASSNATEASQLSLPTPSPAITPAPVEVAHGPSIEPLHWNSLSSKEEMSRSTPDIPMSDLENIMREQRDLKPVFHHYPDNHNLPYLNNFMQGFAEKREGISGAMLQGPPEAGNEATQQFPSEPTTPQFSMLSSIPAPTTSNSRPEHEQQKEWENHPHPPIQPVDVNFRFPPFKKYEKSQEGLVPGTSGPSLNVSKSFPEARNMHLNEHPSQHYTPDRSIPGLENIIQGQEGRFKPFCGLSPDNRLLPNLNRLPFAFAEKHDLPLGGQVEAGKIVVFQDRTQNRTDSECDESQAEKDLARIGSVESGHCWTARREFSHGDPNSTQTPLGELAKRGALRRDIYVDEFLVSQPKFECRIRSPGSGCRDVPLAQMDCKVHGRARHSPVPASPRTIAGFDGRSRSVPHPKPPPLGPRKGIKARMSNLNTVVACTSHNQVVALSDSRSLSPNLQSISSQFVRTSEPVRSSSTETISSPKDTTLVSLPGEPAPPTPYTPPFQIVAPDGASSYEQIRSKPLLPLTPTTSSANDITMVSLAEKPLSPALRAPIPIERTRMSTSPSHAPRISAAMSVSMGLSAGMPAPSTPSTQPLPLSMAALPPSLKRKGKEKAHVPEISDDESSVVQDDFRQTKKAKLWHDPVIDVSRIFGDLTAPIACSSKTRLEDLPVTQSSPFPEIPHRNSDMVVEDQLPPLSTSSPMKSAKRRGRPPKLASSISSSSKIIRPKSPRDRIKKSASSSASQSILSSQMPAQMSVVAMEDQLPPSSVSAATKPGEWRRGLSQAVKTAPSNSAPASSIASGYTPDELPSISSSVRTRSQMESSTAAAAPVQWSENGIPLPIPVEIQALVDAYINGAPIGVFASSSHLQGIWGLKLVQGKEIGYAFMGFYRVCRVLESLDEDDAYGGENEKHKEKKGKAAVVSEVSKTRVRWRFRLRWEPGGEGWQIRDPQRLTSPWWNPNLKAQELAVGPLNSSEDSDDESTQKYRLARRRNQNFPRRHCYFDQTFCSVLPLHLLAPINAEIPDAVLPRGWHCPDCGKLNFRYYLRHRRCDSSYCQDKPVARGYMVEIDRLRDPQDGMPLALPLDNVPGHIRANSRVRVWDDKMKTLIYCFETGIVGGMAKAQHIFTCNLPDLQRLPSELFNSIQVHVPLRRPTGDTHTSPYFVHSVDGVGGDAEDSSSWVTAPQCLHHAKEVMNDRGRKYGKKTTAELNINRLIIRAWVTSGSKRASFLSIHDNDGFGNDMIVLMHRVPTCYRQRSDASSSCASAAK
ncbi:hypothetical protein AGABI1DRAFT_125924 [Agaricus bisporus var. burnettii JB137-S8]|uniref:Uncharacterized protein n=1 Tax=Agaricus bisporus var. burnettii (strain JB137-S8 / ATCC MYA-4627 / FGSC 10392) TaxID=597362 RepID=K5Y158_AGABU|nr:uncharacterized protein AGABI1DRAFT_125924 [Agaricus bisporus var. burnettii JB137-S8]EKM81545.1 hypothetical protein AGABI1DRAFT_125924 [Agaricus bisporus var. burnettii JB137-S8]